MTAKPMCTRLAFSSACKCAGAALLLSLCLTQTALAQEAPREDAPGEAQMGGWGAGVTVAPPATAPQLPNNTTIIKRSAIASPDAADANEVERTAARVKLVAMLTADGQDIDQGIVWRIFEEQGADAPPRLLQTHRSASPSVELKPGKYIVNAAFGRANLTRTLDLQAGYSGTEKFVINAGGLRVSALVGGKDAPANAVSYDIYEGEPNQLGERGLVMSSAKPGVIIRLNAGIYHIVSTYGDGNAKIATDVTVEAGKLTEATLTHAAAKVTFGLVSRPGGEAQPSTQWTISTPDGDVIKRSVGALPTHILAPGTYKVTASHDGRVYEQQFEVKDGQMTRIDVLMP